MFFGLSFQPLLSYSNINIKPIMQTKTKKDWTNTLFVTNIGVIALIVGVVIGQFVKIVV